MLSWDAFEGSGPIARKARWVPPGETVRVAGFSLPNGMVYVGSGLPPIQRWAGPTEPALINPALLIARSNPDLQGRLMSYWPSYRAIPAECRAGYLRWLADGRKNPDAGIGYVFLFLYGLERRLLFDHAQSGIPRGERNAILDEVERLLGIYGGNDSFRSYASKLHSLGLVLRGSIDITALKPPVHRDSMDLPIVTSLVLGVLAAGGKPLPVEWAHSWIQTSPSFSLRTPAQRCPDEFRELFFLRYRESYGDGIKLRPNKTRLKVDYFPASPSFGGFTSVPLDLPDVEQSTTTFDRLRRLAQQCTDDLAPYSSWVRRTGETGSPAAVTLLPAPLALGRGDAKTLALNDWLEARLDGRGLALIESSELIRRWPCKAAGRPSGRELVMLSDFLVLRGLGIEPDAALGGSSLARTPRAALFRLPGGSRDKASHAFESAAVLLHVAAMVADANGGVSAGDERHVMQHLATAPGLTAADRVRLEARFRWLAIDPPTLSSVKKGLRRVAEGERRALGPLLISFAGADGHLGPEAVKVLTQVYPLLGLEAQSLYSDLHQLMSAQTAPAGGPVPVRPAEPAPGFAIPRPGRADKTASPAVELDLDKVRAKLAETERVSSLLGQIFVDEEAPKGVMNPEKSENPGIPETPENTEPTLAGLDGAHSALLLRLSGSATWERAGIERLAGDFGLLPDGALEVINEAAFALCGAPLLEGDEIIEIDQEVLQEMLP